MPRAADKREALAEELCVDAVPLGMKESDIRELHAQLSPQDFEDAVAENNEALGALVGGAAIAANLAKGPVATQEQCRLNAIEAGFMDNNDLAKFGTHNTE